MGRCEPSTGIEPFGRLMTQVMEQDPYRFTERVFWVGDNGSSHRGRAAVRPLMQAYTNAILLHTPVPASWLNQVESYVSLARRKVLIRNAFASLAEVEQMPYRFRQPKRADARCQPAQTLGFMSLYCNSPSCPGSAKLHEAGGAWLEGERISAHPIDNYLNRSDNPVILIGQ